jgi:putative FmdB family regulatory protein
MPSYSYKCKSCGHRFDGDAKMSAPNPPCPECKAETEKVPTAPSFHLKGGGWAEDGYHHQVGPYGSDLSGVGRSEG